MRKRMKNLCIFFSFLVLSALLAGCGNKIEVEINFDAVVEANKTEVLLERYQSFSIDVEYEGGEYSYYADPTLVYHWESEYTDEYGEVYAEYGEVITDDFYAGVSMETYYSIAYFGEEIDNSWTQNLMINPEIFVSETLISSVAKDGFIFFETKLTEETMVNLGYWEDGKYENCYYVTEYTMDAETFVIYNVKETYVCGPFESYVTEYVLFVNEELPEEAADIYEHVTSADEHCAATVVYDPNTAEERSFSVQVPKGDIVYFYWADDDVYVNVYADRVCTKPFGYSAIANEDVEIYVTK